MILLDFDDVIFNTKQYKKDFFQLFRNFGISEEEFKQTYYNEIREGVKKYDLENQLKQLFPEGGENLEKLRLKINQFLADLEKYIFEDFYRFSDRIGKENLEILSFGDKEMQRIKIENSQSFRFVAGFEIIQEKKGDYLEKEYSNREIVLVDDRPDQLESCQALKNFRLIRMKRKEGRYYDLLDNGNLETVENFDQLAALLSID